MDSFGLEKGPEAGCCEQGNETSGIIKRAEFPK
jgi:hypothetical protein